MLHPWQQYFIYNDYCNTHPHKNLLLMRIQKPSNKYLKSRHFKYEIPNI